MQAVLRRIVALLCATGAVLGLAVAVSAALSTDPAGAAVTDGVVRGGPHDPFGRVRYVNAVPGGVELIGFAIDPDALTSNVRVWAIVDGRVTSTNTLTSVARPDVTTAYNAGPTPAFDLTVPTPAGIHTVCLAAQSIGVGGWTVLRCVATPVGTVLSSAQLAAHTPVGALTHLVVTPGRLRLAGWSSDPDFVSMPTTAVVFVDGQAVAHQISNAAPPTPTPAGAGRTSGWLADVPLADGAHIVCAWVSNVGFGADRSLGCRAFDTRGPAGTAPVVPSPINAAVLTEALKHRGQAYVWGATGPKTFDCSGLVVYSYSKQGISLPHQSEMQALQARMIPASRAIPGDLVFTHDAYGDVYHVGIYVAPGQAFAAIDTQQGVNYQNIWDPGNTTYGSLTHT